MREVLLGQLERARRRHTRPARRTPVELQPAPVGGDKGHADRRVVERAPEPLGILVLVRAEPPISRLAGLSQKSAARRRGRLISNIASHGSTRDRRGTHAAHRRRRARPTSTRFAPYAAFLAAGGVDGILALGSTGEGILLSVAERKDVLAAFAAGELPVIAHCGAQTTADTVALAEHAATAGAAGVAVIGPPYFPLDDESLLAPLRRRRAAPARRCRSTSTSSSGSPATPSRSTVVERLRELAPNLAGLKVSDAPFDKVRPYLRRRPRRLRRRRGADRRGARRRRGRRGQRTRLGVPRRRGRGGAHRRLDAGRRAARAARPLPAPRRVEGGRRVERRADAARTCAPRCGGCPTTSGGAVRRARRVLSSRTSARRSRRGRARARRRGVRRRCAGIGCSVATRLVGLGLAAGVGRRAGSRRGAYASSSAGEAPCGNAGRGRRRSRARRPKAPASSASRRFTATDATLPQLLATPVAPSPEAAQGGGADSVHEKEEFGFERVRDHAFAGPRAR